MIAALLTVLLLHSAPVCCNLDIDGNGQVKALSDGILLGRYMNGVRGPALVNGISEPGATRTTGKKVAHYLGHCKATLADVDGDGNSTIEDVNVVVGYLAGLRDSNLLNHGLPASGCVRCTPDEWEAYIAALIP